MRLWSQLVATALLLPTLGSVLFLYGLGIITIPEFARATIREAPALVVRGTNAIVEVATDLLPKSNPVAETTPPSPPPPATKVAVPVAPAPPPLDEVVLPQPDSKGASTRKKVAERPAPVEVYGPPEPPRRPAELRTRVSQNLPRDFGFAETGGGVADGSGVFAGNPKANGAFGDFIKTTAKSVDVAKSATPAPSRPKIAEVVVPPAPEVPPANIPPLPSVIKAPQPRILGVDVPSAASPAPSRPKIAEVVVPPAPEIPPANIPPLPDVIKAPQPRILGVDVPLAPEVPPAQVPPLLTPERKEKVAVEKPRPARAIEPREVISLPPAAASAAPVPDPAADRLFKRALIYMKLNDFSAARLLLTHASDAGHVDATLALAEMYDPEKQAPPGITPDAAKARALYEKAKLRQ